ncbi:MAG: hypothetical protein IJC49_03200 [Clostridia bacterium]|nr:hypothetical protein [Clostridia bacterium]
MKKKIFRLMALLLCICTLTACGGNTSSTNASKEEEGGNADYSVTVTDCFGTPLTSGVVVLYMKDGKQAAMQVVNDKGVAVKSLEKGDYTVELKFTDSSLAYSYEKITLSADKTAATVELLNETAKEGKKLYTPTGEFTAYDVKEGGTSVSLKKGRNYYLFTPKIAGTYEFTTSDNDYAVGYYGIPSYVQAQSAAEVVDNSFTVSVSDSMIGKGDTGTTVIVVGVDTAEDAACVLKIKRIGDPEYSIADEPWTIYKASYAPEKFTLESGVNLKNFDLTAKTEDYALVYNDEDGSYHLGSKDGARVYVWLAEEPAYMASFKTVLESVGMNRYFFDENGKFVKKESYTDCLLSYIECADSNKGVYPLTKDLEYIIKQCGEQNGWWKTDSHGFIFYTSDEQPLPDLNTDIAWLFMCCYAE